MDFPPILGLGPELSEAFARLGYGEPTRVQRLAVPLILEGKDLFVQSETGTGKTFAYLAPAFSRVKDLDPGRGPLVLVVCPTQELVVQTAKKAEELAKAAGLPLGVCPVLGGSPLSRQEGALKRKPAVVVGSPGRSLDLLSLRALRLEGLRFLVLDECDRLFGKEYRDAVTEILRRAPKAAVKVLASATILDSTKAAARPFMREPASVDLLDEGVLSSGIEHWAFYSQHRGKLDLLRRLDAALRPSRCLVFASSGERVAKAASLLKSKGVDAASLLSRGEKEERRIALERFGSGLLRYLVTSDLGARGLDIPDIDHVVSLDFPEEASYYIHRAGRTGRAGRKGISILFADSLELRRASRLAVERGFVFRTKVLREGQVLEPPVGEFFDEVERLEGERRDYLRQRDAGPRERR